MERKNSLIGYLASLLIHIFVIAIVFLLIHKKEQDITTPPPPKGQELKLADFNAPPPKPQPQQQQIKPQPQTSPQSKVVKQQKQQPKIVSTQNAIAPIKQKEQNKTKNEQKNIQETIQTLPKPQINPTQQQQPTQAQKAQSSSGSSLLDALNTEVEKEKKQEVGAPIKKLYGKEFEQMTPAQQKFIQDNLSGIGRITQQYLKYPEIAGKMNISGQNVVEFMLQPNGDITDLKLYQGSGYEVLDGNSLKTIKIAYKDYPRPSQPTKIRIYVRYTIY